MFRHTSIKMLGLLIFQTFIMFVVGQDLFFPDQVDDYQNFDYQNNRFSPFRPLQSPNVHYSDSQAKYDAPQSIQVSSSSSSAQIPREPEYWANHVNNIISRGVTNFGLKLNRVLQNDERQRDPDNIVFSPTSLVETLSMVLLGSAGKTFNEVVKILGFDRDIDVSLHSEIIHRLFGLKLQSIVTNKGDKFGPQITSANGIFVQDGYPIRPEFLAISKGIYHNDVINVNFRENPWSARQIVNEWVDKMTRGRINTLLSDPPSYDTKVILASTLYFNAEWNQHFMAGSTKQRPFTLPSGQTITVDMMFNGGKFPFYEDQQLGVMMLALPYKNGAKGPMKPAHFSEFESTMYLMLPTSDSSNSLADLENRLTPEIIDSLISHLKVEACIIAVPKMKLSTTLNLNRALQALGLSSLFVPGEANLALLSPGLETTKWQNQDPIKRDDDGIFSRFGEQTESPNNERDFSNKKGYIKYEDIRGGYSIQQWSNGVYIENNRKIKSPSRSKRSSPNNDDDTVNENNIKINSLHNQKNDNLRNKRQTINDNFRGFIERQDISQFGIDTLRNSGQLGNPGLFASDVLHKVEIDITETGTVAASATSVTLNRSGNYKRFVADRPFNFIIRHNPTKLILFQGTINKPTPNYS
ncbi:leukocyte elastase inhibitor B-like [Aphidius gifuensis]|uniref:leukocyte elastase inhibitor B-like n=1 Tax=Aphidius gifuensis TaxID=684658 RepID=UPI001CDC87C7|nr:leukocyte elastase inhibitor B-like [Aphidius gifuensis]